MDVLVGIYQVIGAALLIPSYAIPDRVPPPLRPGARLARSFTIAPFAAAGHGVAMQLTW